MLMTLSILAMSVLAGGQPAPADWDKTSLRTAQLMANGKAADAIALLEPIVAKAPSFEAAEYELARAHQFRAGEFVMAGSPEEPARRRHLEQAARLLQRVADRNGQYRQPALGWLLWLYDKDDLDKPVERAVAARHYIALDPRSPIGYLARAASFRATGQDDSAWAVLDAACAAVGPDGAGPLTRGILMHLGEALPFVVPGSAPTGGAPKELARLLDCADAALGRELAADASDRGAILAKATSLTLRAQRLERDAARRKALEAEADALLGRNRAANARAKASPPAADTRPPHPPGFSEALEKAMALVGRQQYVEAIAIYDGFIVSHPAFAPPHYLRVDALIRAGRSAAVDAALRDARRAIPATYYGRYDGAVFLEELVRKNATIAPAGGMRALAEAVALLDDALAAKPNDSVALIYKSLAVRGQVRFTQEPGAAQKLTAEADRLLAAAKAAQSKPNP